MRKLWVCSLLCFSLSLVPLLRAPSASAAPPRPSDDDATVAMARERFKEGVSFFDKKEFDKARLAFLQAYALKKHPAVLLNLAQSELRSGHEAEAAKHFSAYLRESRDASDAERQAADAGLNASKAVVAELDVNVDETAAEIYLDNAQEGLSPLPGPLYLNPGPHTVEARKEGRTATAQVVASAGKQLHTDLRLAAKPPPPPVASSPSDAESPPPLEPATPSGGRKPFFRWLTSSPVGIVGLGLTGAGLGVGVGTALASNHDYKNATSIADQIKENARLDTGGDTSNLCTDPRAWLLRNGYPSSPMAALDKRTSEYQNACTKYVDTTKNGDTLKTVATVGFIVGGVAAVGTVVYYFLDTDAVPAHDDARTARAPRIALVPTIGPAHTGLSLIGSF